MRGEIKEQGIKVFATLGMLALTVVFCYLPWVVNKKWRKATLLISLLNCLAGGVVLGAFIPHPESGCNGFYQWGCVTAGISFLVLFSVDRLFLSHAHCENETEKITSESSAHEHEHSHHDSHDDHDHHHHHHNELSNKGSVESFQPHQDCHEADIMGGCHMEGIRTSKSKLQTYVFVFCLSLHSLLEGLGMSGKNDSSELMKFLIGLFAHKWIEAFALGITVMSARFSHLESFFMMSFYAILTPIGIVLGMLADLYSTPNGKDKNISELVMNGAAAGSFLFVSCIEMIPPEFHTKNQSTPAKFMAVVIGFLFMAAAAAFHPPH